MALFPPGEAEARKRLDAFIVNRIHSYKDKHDIPSVDGTSSLSPYIALGLISARECVVRAKRVNEGKIAGMNNGPVKWITQVCTSI